MARDELNIPRPGINPSQSFRVPRRKSALESNTKRMAIVAGGLAAGLALLMGAWSLTTPRRGGVPVVQADNRPIRVKPENPGGMDVDGKDASILDGSSDVAAKIAPPPEAPEIAALKKQADAAAQAAAAAKAPPPVPARTAVVAPSPAAQPTPAAQPQAAQPPAPAKPATQAAAPSKPPAPAAPAGKSAQVQLAAVLSEDAAHSEWQRLEHKMPDLLGGKKPAVSKVDVNGRTLWRVRTGGFADVGEATMFCERVRQKGGGCTVASF